MITKQQFISLSQEQQKGFLSDLIGKIETKTNQEILLCQRLLEIISHPSSKTLLYIFDIVDWQLQAYHQGKIVKNNEKVKQLLQHIQQEEEIEKADVEKILDSLSD